MGEFVSAREFESRPRRIDTSVDAVLTAPDGHHFPVTIRDISASGVRIEFTDELLVGERLTLRIGKREELRLEIKWVLGFEAGATFLDPPEPLR